MAGRSQKNNADWFSHDADASGDEKLVYLESLFGHTGYALYFKFLECMTRSDGFKLPWNDIKKAVYASKFGISVTEMDRFITECCRQEVKAFEIDTGFIFSPGLIKRLEPLLAKREYNRQKYQEQKQEVEEKQNDGSISVTEMTQSKVKESKEKNTICSEPENPDSELDVFIKIPLIPKDGEYPVTFSQVEEWQLDFPGVNVKQQIRNIKQWNKANPDRRKTKRGINKHIVSWLSRAQDKAGAKSKPVQTGFQRAF